MNAAAPGYPAGWLLRVVRLPASRQAINTVLNFIFQLRSGFFLISRNRMVAMQFPLLDSMALLLLLGASPVTLVSEAVDAHTQTYRPASSDIILCTYKRLHGAHDGTQKRIVISESQRD